MNVYLFLVPCLLVAAAAAAALSLFFQLKRELAAEVRDRERAVADLSRQIERLRRRPAPAEPPRFSTAGEFSPAEPPAAASRPDGAAPVRRTQILIRLRAGEPPSQIAEALQIPVEQVDLVAQLHQLGL